MINLGGTFRAVTPEESLQRIAPLLWNPFQITRVANVTGLDSIGIYTYVAMRPNTKSLSSTQGKGITPELAKISAIMEAVEMWHAEHLPPPDLCGSYNTLKKKYNLYPIELHQQHISREFYFPTILDQEMDWLRAEELNSGKTMYVPSCLINLDYTRFSPASLCLHPSSNGLASGNTLEEATCHGLYEVIERQCEAEAIAPFKKLSVVNLAECTSPHLQCLLKKIADSDHIITVYDMTNNINLPAYQAVLDHSSIRSLANFIGSGAHFLPSVAISRAITEAAQTRLTHINGTRDDLYPSAYQRAKTYQGKLHYDHQTMISYREDFAIPQTFQACLTETLNLLKKQGIDIVIRYNHTRKEWGIPVVHMLVPGLKFNAGFHTNE